MAKIQITFSEILYKKIWKNKAEIQTELRMDSKLLEILTPTQIIQMAMTLMGSKIKISITQEVIHI